MEKKRGDWFGKCMRQVHMDFHMPDFPNEAINSFNAEEFVKHLVHGKINMVALFAKCHFGMGFYNTKVGTKHPGLPNDFLGEATAECQKNGIKTLAYYSLTVDKYAYDNYPHWREVPKDDGEPVPVAGPWAMVCVNTPYAEELVLPQIEEILRDYKDIDGLWIDIPGGRPCFCEYCKEKYRILYGKELTENTPADEIRAFNMQATTKVLKEMKLLRDKYNPEAILLTNESWGIHTPRDMSVENDVGCWESQPHTNYLSHSFVARHVRTLPVPVQVMSVRFYQGWGDLTLKSAAQMTTEFASMIGNGTMAVSGDQVQVNGTLQPAVYDMFNYSFGFVEEREELLLECKSVKDTALVVPVKSSWHDCQHAKGDSQLGAHKALVESQVQFDVLSSLDLIAQADDYNTIVLTEPNEYSEEVIAKLAEWVEQGGTLVACGGSLLKDGKFALEEIFGFEYLEPAVFAASYFLPKEELRGGADDLPMQLRARSHKVIPTTASSLADFYYPEVEQTPVYSFRSFRSAPPQIKPSMFPFTTINEYGKGRAVYMAGSIFEAYWQSNHHWLRQAIDGLFQYLKPQPLFRLDAPPILEGNLMEHEGGDLLLNVIHYQVGHQACKDAIPAIEKVHPIKDVPCRVKASNVSKISLEPTGEEISFEQDGDFVSFVIPEIKYLGMIRISTK